MLEYGFSEATAVGPWRSKEHSPPRILTHLTASFHTLLCRLLRLHHISSVGPWPWGQDLCVIRWEGIRNGQDTFNPPHPFAAQLKSINFRENGQSPAPRRQKTAFSIFQMGGGQACRDQTKPKRNQNQNHTPEKATAETGMPIFGVIGRSFTFAQNEANKQQKMFPAWLGKK